VKRSLALVGALALASAAPAAAADAVSLTASSTFVRFRAPVTLAGSVAPAVPGEPVTIMEGATPVWSGVTAVDGTFGTTVAVQRATAYAAVVGLVRSRAVPIRMRPILRAGVRGPRVVGASWRVSGRVLPHQAGRVTVRSAGRRYRARVDRSGRFRVTVQAGGPGRVQLRVLLRPARGYVRTSRRLTLRVRSPNLSYGARGAVVSGLERRLAALGYALRGVDGLYAGDTRDAVLAFQKVSGLPRTGRVDPQVWRALRAARTPSPRVRGNHVEVYKSRQVVYEVRGGRVVAIAHASTGATGNTPLGTWRVYRKVTGWDWILWYPLYFLRGFALHGYPSVPAYPASHGCVRLPMWFAQGFHARWPHGATVRIFP
jgi:Putative peptidoglycan binding domain/L,D-transpeptidase catalytic domain